MANESQDIDRENELYYNHYFDLFRTEGWKQLVQELTTNAGAINNVAAIKDDCDMYFRKGQLNVLTELIHFESLIYNAHKEWAEGD